MPQIDPNNPPWPAYRGYHTYSFANATMGHRLPTILGKAIDDVLATVNTLSQEDEIVDLLGCVERMETLKSDLEGNGKLRSIMDDGEADVALWNKEITKYFLGMSISRPPSSINTILTPPINRQGFHERHMAFRRGIQISTSARVL